VPALDLKQQAFPDILGAYSGRIERLNYAQTLLNLFWRVVPGFGDFLQCGGEIAILVKVTDDILGGVTHGFRHDQHAQLRMKMVAEGDRRGKEGLERWLFDIFRGRALVAWIQIFVEEGAE